ncbi:uncharacterized protein LOC117788595 [Drosophila innubila]|uniref:uncharacterized protein LOC117788595 n=1 Tax=Drosophila innubila TaxID=198719 RepID=UPI00148CEDDE|nr:uncharacterized protein LOC117788595 [Drosophila innubila]
MSHADNTQTKPAIASEPPKACKGCSGLQPRPKLIDLEDLDKIALETLIRKASIAQQMLTDLMEQLTKVQANKRLNQTDFFI